VRVLLLLLLCVVRAAAEPAARLEVPDDHAYTGAYIEFGERENEVTLEAIEEFEALVRHEQAIVAFSDEWGLQSFPSKQLAIVSAHGALPLVYWLPWKDRRSDEKHPDTTTNPFALEAIADGRWDSYIDRWGAAAAAFGKPIFVSFAPEMNGDWFSWGGVYHGGGKRDPSCETCYRGPSLYIRAYRRVVDRIRAKGAANVIWVWQANNTSWPPDDWNQLAHYYPGPTYADWIGMSAYGEQFPPPGQTWISLENAILRPYRELAKVDPAKPIMLAEWGVGEFPKQGSKAEWIAEFFRQAPKLPRLHAAIVWHERWQNDDLSFSNLRVGSSPDALAAYRNGVHDAFWSGRPALVPARRETKADGKE
jgi:Glycosyl hydrolase family 26